MFFLHDVTPFQNHNAATTVHHNMFFPPNVPKVSLVKQTKVFVPQWILDGVIWLLDCVGVMATSSPNGISAHIRTELDDYSLLPKCLQKVFSIGSGPFPSRAVQCWYLTDQWGEFRRFRLNPNMNQSYSQLFSRFLYWFSISEEMVCLRYCFKIRPWRHDRLGFLE